VEGESLLPLIAGTGDFRREQPLFWEHEGHRAVRDGQWKLVAEENKPWELYDMSVDRGEMNDLAAHHPDRVKQMAAAWQGYAEGCAVQPYGAHRLRKRAPEPEGAPDRLSGLKSGTVYKRQDSPVLSDAGVTITARITRMAEGVLVAQGAEAHGYALYVHGGRAHFIARRAGELCKVSSQPIEGDGAATITARLERDGRATIQVNEAPAAAADFFGPLLETPADGLSVGFDGGKPVGDYPGEFAFKGEIASVDVTTVNKDSR
jgi:arylsulfatase